MQLAKLDLVFWSHYKVWVISGILAKVFFVMCARVKMLARIRALHARTTYFFHAQSLQIAPISCRFVAYSRAYRERGP